jgi:TatD DNase family protein
VPEEQLLVETDAPFLTPHPHRGRANEPYCLPWTVRGIAALRGVTDERLATSARRNAERIFGLADVPPAAHPRTGGTDGARSA